jgi:hypothetical protein
MFKFLLMIPLLSSVILAADRTGFSIGNLLPVLTGAGGIAVTLFGLLPLVLRMQRTVSEAAQETQSFIQRYRGKVSQNELKQDLEKLFQRYDAVTEAAADIARRIRMKRAERWLRGLITGKMAL